MLQIDWCGVVLITKVEEEGPGSDCAVAPRDQIWRCAFQQVQSTILLTFSINANLERATDIASNKNRQND